MTKKKPTPRPRKTPHPRQASDAITIVAPATTLGPDRTAASAKPAQTRGSPKNTNVNAPLSVYTSWKFRMMNTPMTTSAPNNGHSMAPNFCFPMLQTSAADTMWTMASESSEGPPSERGNTGARQVVTRRSNRKLLILIWVIFVGSSVVLAWAWFTQTEGALPLLGYGWAGAAILGAITLVLSARERFIVDRVGVHRLGAPFNAKPIPWAKVDRIRRDSNDQRKGRLRIELSTLVPKKSAPRIDLDCNDDEHQQILEWHRS